MKSYLKPALFISCSIISQSLLAVEGAEKKLTIGAGAYALKINYENDYIDTENEFSGMGFAASYAFSNSFAIKGVYYTLEHDEHSEVEATGADVMLYIGSNLASHGFKIYIGGGAFSETWELGATEVDYSGVQFNFGLGYNWDPLAIDFVLGIRDTTDYEDDYSSSSDTDIIAASGSLILSARF